MNKITKAMLASALVGASGLAQAEVTANVAVVSEYLFRGVGQSNGAAMQGGLDYKSDSGIYLGTWLSNVDFGGNVETDLYGGYSGEINGVGYDIGGIYYWYPDAGGDKPGSTHKGGGELDYAEISLGLSYGALSASVAYTVWGESDSKAPFNEGDLYYHLGGEFPLQQGFSLTAQAGYYKFADELKNDSESYAHYGLGLAKDAGNLGAMSVNVEFTDLDENNGTLNDDGPNIWVGWSKDIE